MARPWSYPAEWRVVYAGMTRSGKTEAMSALIALHLDKVPILMLDTKGTRKLKSLRAFHIDKLQDLPKFKGERLVVYHPHGPDLHPLRLDLFCQWAYENLRPGIVGIDEAGQLNKGGHIALPGYNNLYTRGQEAGVGVHAGSQRPVGVPVMTFSESSLFLKFYLGRLEDRKTVANYSHPLMVENIPVEKGPDGKDIYQHGCHLWDARERNVVRLFKEVVHLEKG